MKARTCIFAAIFFGQISKLEGFLSDDEDLLTEGPDSRSGSGDGCFQIPTDRNCTCSTFFDCVQTCSDMECDLALVDCLDGGVYGNCRSRLNSTITSDENSTAVNKETTLIIVGSVLPAIFLTATIIIFALRNKECCCTRTGNGSKHADVFQPQLVNQDRKTAKVLISPIQVNVRDNSRNNEQAPPNMVSFSTKKSVVNQHSTFKNDYQELSDINRKQNGMKSDRSSTVLDSSSEHWKKADEEYQNIEDIDQNYPFINSSIPPYHLRTTTEEKPVDRNDPMSYYQPMNVTDHYWTMTSPDVDLYIPMAESAVSEDGGEYAKMGGSIHRTSNVYVNGMLRENLYHNETVAQRVADYSNDSGDTMEEEVYEKIDN
ncbi:uncharacterized protein LOC125664175 isoform X2 [Ostrea edulis]|uniref:uncharacterized protein LOC125664175 isoform X2 n=1 Tax=Ostrea edulis TaxID=37623 RepID=UPI0024AED9A2|nr:uncharacterized protein LOC125664175 isoform X2 [Ostrea edulis]